MSRFNTPIATRRLTATLVAWPLQRLGYLRDEGRNNRSYYAIPLRPA